VGLSGCRCLQSGFAVISAVLTRSVAITWCQWPHAAVQQFRHPGTWPHHTSANGALSMTSVGRIGLMKTVA